MGCILMAHGCITNHSSPPIHKHILLFQDQQFMDPKYRLIKLRRKTESVVTIGKGTSAKVVNHFTEYMYTSTFEGEIMLFVGYFKV